MKSFIISVAIVVYLGFLQKWHFILSGDLQNYYFPIAKHIFTPQTLIYPPGANLFFMLLPSASYDLYQLAFVTANVALVFLLAFLTKKPGLLGLLVLCAGPIILFRFDLLVITLLAISLLAFGKSRYCFSGFFLGLATATKLFPVILLPYFLLCLWREKKEIGKFWRLLISFFIALAGTFLLYIAVTGQEIQEVLANLTTVLKVSVHMESVMGTILTLVTGVTNPGPHGVDFINAIWVLDPLYYLGHDRVFGYFGLLGLGSVFLLILLKNREFRVSICLLLVLTLVTTSRIFSPQYIIWVAFLSLLANIKKLDTGIILLTLICTQIIYPLNYGELIDFFDQGKNWWLFGILATRNLLLVILAVRLLINEKLLPFLPKR